MLVDAPVDLVCAGRHAHYHNFNTCIIIEFIIGELLCKKQQGIGILYYYLVYRSDIQMRYIQISQMR